MVNFKDRVEFIRYTIDCLQNDIYEMDKNFQYYNVLIHNLCVNPMEIRVFRKVDNSEPLLIETIYIDLLDWYSEITNNLGTDTLKKEVEYLKMSNAPLQQVSELRIILEKFGIITR
jgi:hypothetical protein